MATKYNYMPSLDEKKPLIQAEQRGTEINEKLVASNSAQNSSFEYLLLGIDVSVFALFCSLLLGGQILRDFLSSGIHFVYYVYPFFLILFCFHLKNAATAVRLTYINPVYKLKRESDKGPSSLLKDVFVASLLGIDLNEKASFLTILYRNGTSHELWLSLFFTGSLMFTEQIAIAHSDISWFTSTLIFPSDLQEDASLFLYIINTYVKDFFDVTNNDIVLIALAPVYPKIETIRQRVRTILFVLYPDLIIVRDGKTSDYTFDRDTSVQVSALVFGLLGLCVPFWMFRSTIDFMQSTLLWTVAMMSVITALVSSFLLSNLAYATLVGIDDNFVYTAEYHSLSLIALVSFVVMLVSCVALQIIPSKESKAKATLWTDFIKKQNNDDPGRNSKSAVTEFLLSETCLFSVVVVILTAYLITSGSPIERISITKLASNQTLPTWTGNNHVEQAFEDIVFAAATAFKSNDSTSSVIKIILKTIVTDTGSLIKEMAHSIEDLIPCFTIPLPDHIPTGLVPFDLPSIPSITIPDYCFGLSSILQIGSSPSKTQLSSVVRSEMKTQKSSMHVKNILGDAVSYGQDGVNGLENAYQLAKDAIKAQEDAVTNAITSLSDVLGSSCVSLSALTALVDLPMTFVNGSFTTPSFSGYHVDYSNIKLNIQLPSVCLGELLGNATDSLVNLVELAMNLAIDAIFALLTENKTLKDLIDKVDAAFSEVFKFLAKQGYNVYSSLLKDAINIDNIVPQYIYYLPAASIFVMFGLVYVGQQSENGKVAVSSLQRSLLITLFQGLLFGVYIIVAVKTILLDFGFKVQITWKSNITFFVLLFTMLPICLFQLMHYERANKIYDSLTYELKERFKETRATDESTRTEKQSSV